MEGKKVLNEEKAENVSGGLDLTNKEKFLESLKSLDLKSGKIPKELLDKVSGGSVFGGELNDWDIDYLDTCISDYQAHGIDLEHTLRYMMNCNFSNEALWYVGTHW